MSQRTNLRGLRRSPAIACAAILGGLASLASCHPPEFPRELFTLHVDGANYPVMLSRTPAGAGGRRIGASSGTQVTRIPSGDRTVITTTQTRMPTSMQLAAQVGRSGRWVQIDSAEFHAEDVWVYLSTAGVRWLSVQGTVYP